jgi:hypothetical protein
MLPRFGKRYQFFDRSHVMRKARLPVRFGEGRLATNGSRSESESRAICQRICQQNALRFLGENPVRENAVLHPRMYASLHSIYPKLDGDVQKFAIPKMRNSAIAQSFLL